MTATRQEDTTPFTQGSGEAMPLTSGRTASPGWSAEAAGLTGAPSRSLPHRSWQVLRRGPGETRHGAQTAFQKETDSQRPWRLPVFTLPQRSPRTHVCKCQDLGRQRPGAEPSHLPLPLSGGQPQGTRRGSLQPTPLCQPAGPELEAAGADHVGTSMPPPPIWCPRAFLV